MGPLRPVITSWPSMNYHCINSCINVIIIFILTYVQSNAIKFAPIYTICTRHSSFIEFSRVSLVFGVSAPYPGL